LGRVRLASRRQHKVLDALLIDRCARASMQACIAHRNALKGALSFFPSAPMMRRGNRSQQEDSARRPFGVTLRKRAIPAGTPQTTGRSLERRTATPRAPRKTRGEVTCAPWPRRRRPRRRPQRRARRNNRQRLFASKNDEEGRWCAAPHFIGLFLFYGRGFNKNGGVRPV
jgi:hypothetical protein